MKSYDVVIIGAGPAGIFCAGQVAKRSHKKVLLLEKGVDLPKRDPNIQAHCLYGFAGAGAFSDGKLTLSLAVGGDLEEVHHDCLEDLLTEVDDTFMRHGAPSETSGSSASLRELERKAVQSGLSMIPFPVRHMGTDLVPKVMESMRRELLADGVDLQCENPAGSRIEKTEGGFIIRTPSEEFSTESLVLAVGRGGGGWLKSIHGLPLEWRPGYVDIGVRLEVPRIIFDPITDLTHDPKLIYYSTLDDKVRSFCVNPGGSVSLEQNHFGEETFYTINGHSNKIEKTEQTNMALLVSTRFTEPFDDPFAYGRSVAHLTNLLGGKALVQRITDFLRGRRSTPSRIQRAMYRPTLKEATPGDISFALPYRQLKDIEEMVQALERLAPGVVSENSYLYATEAKFYGSRFDLSKNMETSTKGLYVVGDCSGWTRGIIQASISGILAAKGIMS